MNVLRIAELQICPTNVLLTALSCARNTADAPTTLTGKHAAGIPNIALNLCKKKRKKTKNEKKSNAVGLRELLM